MTRRLLAAAAGLLAGLLLGAPAARSDEGTAPAPKDPNAPVNAGTETVEVIGEGAVVTDAPTSFVTVIHPDEASGRYTTLADLLSRSAGVRVRSFGGINSFATISIRGSTADQVEVFVDGIPLNNPLGGPVNLADVGLAGVETIEIHRGFTPASLGASSIGGAVNIVTRPAGEGGGEAAATYGTYGTSTLSLRGSGALSTTRWSVSAGGDATDGDFSFLDTNATTIANTADDEMATRVNNASWSSAIRARADRPISPRGTLTASVEWVRRRQGVPGIDAFQSDHATFAMHRGLLRLAGSWSGLGGGRVDLETAFDREYVTEAIEDLEEDPGKKPLDTRTRVAGLGGRLRLLWRPSKAQRVSFLVEPRSSDATAIDHATPGVSPVDAHRDALTAVAEEEVHLASGRLLVAPSLRWDGTIDDRRGGSPGASGPSRSSGALTGRLGGFLAITSRVSARANLGRYYRAPSLMELFGNEGTIAGNPDLLPEQGINADAGVAVTFPAAGAVDQGAVELSVFRTDAGHLIQLVPLPSRQVKSFNIDSARITGVEATASLRLWRRLTASGWATLQKPVDTGDGPSFRSDLPGRPRRTAGSLVSLDLGRAAIHHRFSYVGENELLAVDVTSGLPSSKEGQTRLPSRYLHDAGVTVPLGARATASLEVINLFDRKVVDVARYPLPGRMIHAGLRASF